MPRGWKNGGKLPTAGAGWFFDRREKFVGVLNIIPKKLDLVSEGHTDLQICS